MELSVSTTPYPQQKLSVAPPVKAQPIPIYRPPANQPTLTVAKPVQAPPIAVNNTPIPQPEIVVDNSPRFVRLGAAVKAKFPGIYDSIDDGILGKMVATKYPDVYSQLIDPAYTPVAETKEPEPEGQTGWKGIGLGALKGLGSTLTNVGRLGSKGLELLTGQKIGSNPDVDRKLDELTTSHGFFEKLGFGAEQIGEFFLPDGIVSKASKAAEASNLASNLGKYGPTIAKTAARSATEAATTFGLSKAQGQSNTDAAINAGIAGMLPGISAAVAPLKESLAGRFVNSLIKPKEVDFRFGKNPGLAVAEQGITGNTLNGLKSNIAKARQAIGQQIEKLITTPKTSQIIQDVTPAFSHIDVAINNAVNNGEQELVTRLLSLKNGLTKSFKLVDGKLEEVGVKRLTLNPQEIQQLKIKVGEGTRWTGQAFDTDINQVKTKVYASLNDLVEKAAPGTKQLNQKYGNLLTAEKAVEKRATTAAKNNLVSLPNLGFGGIGAVAGTIASGGTVLPGLLAGAGAIGASKALGSTAVKTRIGKKLGKPAGKGFGVIRKTYFGTRPKN